MICGLDVTHPSKLDRLGNSIASVVASYDSNCVQYYSTSVIQERSYQEILRLEEIFEEFLKKFKERNPFYPENILVYRDGVSEGQYNEVMEKEIASIKKAIENLKIQNVPKLTYIVCQKRHNTR